METGCRGKIVGWWNCGCAECAPKDKDSATTPEEQLRMAIEGVASVVRLHPTVSGADMRALAEVLKNMATCMTLQQHKEEAADAASVDIDVQALMNRVDAQREARASVLPTAETAMAVIQVATERLRDLGWVEIEYSPKDGSVFDSYVMGMPTAIPTSYLGTWPEGGWFTHEAGDIYPAYPSLFRRA